MHVCIELTPPPSPCSQSQMLALVSAALVGGRAALPLKRFYVYPNFLHLFYSYELCVITPPPPTLFRSRKSLLLSVRR